MFCKMSNTKKAIMISILIGSSFLTACGSRPASLETTDNTVSSSSESTTDISYNAFLYNNTSDLSASVGIYDFGLSASKHNDNADRRLQNAPYQNTPIHLSQEHLKEFIQNVNAENITYKYSDLYDIDHAIDQISSYNDQISSQTSLYTDLICDIHEIPSETLLVDTITRNNSSYLSEHKKYDAISSDYTTEIARSIIAVLNAYHDYLDEITLRKIYCMLNDVKVVGIDSADFTRNDIKKVYNAAVLDDATVILDTNQIDQLRQSNSLEKTIYHEVIHLFQRQAPDAKIDGLTQIGNSQYIDSFDDTGEVNSLHYLWLYEASAEYMSMQLNDSKIPLTYKNMVGYLNTLNLITLIQPDYQEDSIAISQMSNDPDRIYEVLDATTAEEKRELMYLLYSICCISDDREDFVGAYNRKYGTGSFEANTDTIKNEMRASIAMTMTKCFYRNLAECTANADVTLEDIFYLINVFESSLSRHLWYDDSSLYPLFKDTLRYYVDTQDSFFQYIAKDSDFTYDEIVDRFQNFAMTYYDDGAYHRNNSFNWLDEDEKTYIGDVFTTNITDFTINIRNITE